MIQKQSGSVQTSAEVGTANGVGAGAAVLAVSLARSSLLSVMVSSPSIITRSTDFPPANTEVVSFV